MSRTKKEVALSSASNADSLSAAKKNKAEVTGSGVAGWAPSGVAAPFFLSAACVAALPFAFVPHFSRKR